MAEVQKVNLIKKSIVGIEYLDKRANKTVTIPFAKNTKLIANCSPMLLDKMLGVDKPSNPKLAKLRPSCSLFTIYLIFDCDIKEVFPDIGYHTHIYPSMSLKEMTYYKKDIY